MAKSERGVVITNGDVPVDSLAFQGASEIARLFNTTVVVTNLDNIENIQGKQTLKKNQKHSIAEKPSIKQ